VPIIGVAVKGFSSHKAAAPAGGRNTDLAAKLITFMGLALADTLFLSFLFWLKMRLDRVNRD
jgi:hypothetical protein